MELLAAGNELVERNLAIVVEIEQAEYKFREPLLSAAEEDMLSKQIDAGAELLEGNGLRSVDIEKDEERDKKSTSGWCTPRPRSSAGSLRC